MGRRRARAASFPCPACGDEVPAGALACRSCGSDDRTGWRDDDPEGYDEDLALPDADLDEEDYQDVVAGLDPSGPPSSTPAWVRVVAIVTLLAIVLTGFLVFL